jgi:2-(1,2-epoxy-1,2-dihydrophenyl)acetyl-CoA isomerase
MKLQSMSLEFASNGIAHLVFTESARGNPIDGVFCADLNAASCEIAGRAGLRCVLITANGRAFSYGGDINTLAADLDRLPDLLVELLSRLNPAIARLQSIEAPIVGAVHGVCAGGMVAIMAACDILLAGADARFVAAYAGIGFSCDAGASIFLARRMGISRARSYLLLNRTLDASAAESVGLVDEVVPTAGLFRRAEEVAAALASGPTGAYGEMRQLLLGASRQPLEAQLELEMEAVVRCSRGTDAREGLRAFSEKRDPLFTGSR